MPSASSTLSRPYPVAAGLPGSQVREGLGEPGGVVHLEQDVGDPRLGQPPVEVGDQVGGPVRNGGFRSLDAKHAVFDALAGGRTGPRRGADPERVPTRSVRKYTARAQLKRSVWLPSRSLGAGADTPGTLYMTWLFKPGTPDDLVDHRRRAAEDRGGSVLRGVPRRPRHGVGRPAEAQPVPGVEPLLRCQPGARPGAEDRVRAAVHVRATAAGEGAAGPAQGRAAPRPGAGRLLRAAGAHQRPRGLRPGERVLVPDADPRLHRLLAGPGDLTAWPRRRTSRSPPTCCVTSARSSGRPSSSTARSRSTPPSSRCDALSVYHNTNGVGTPTTRWPSRRARSPTCPWPSASTPVRSSTPGRPPMRA